MRIVIVNQKGVDGEAKAAWRRDFCHRQLSVAVIESLYIIPHDSAGEADWT